MWGQLFWQETLGFSYAEAEELALSVYRRYVLSLPDGNAREITEMALRSWKSQGIVGAGNGICTP